MLTGLPPLTADEHQLAWGTLEAVRLKVDGKWEDTFTDGWTLVAVADDGDVVWARRKDGRPMVPVDQELIGLRRRVAELERLLKDANGSISVIRAEARERISDLQTDIAHVLRELRLGNHADAEDSLRTALHNSKLGDPND